MFMHRASVVRSLRRRSDCCGAGECIRWAPTYAVDADRGRFTMSHLPSYFRDVGLVIVLVWMIVSAVSCAAEAPPPRCFQCRSEGLCGTSPDGTCYLVEPADCAASELCKYLGWCRSNGSRCVAGDAASCQKTKGCWKEGKCGWREGDSFCTPTDEGCAALCGPGWWQWPECGKAAGPKKCHPIVTDVDCRHRESCKKEGLCSSNGKICLAASDSDCLESDTCLQTGRCRARDGLCSPPDDDWCRAQDECKKFGDCILGSYRECESNEIECTRACRESLGGLSDCYLTSYNLCWIYRPPSEVEP